MSIGRRFVVWNDVEALAHGVPSDVIVCNMRAIIGTAVFDTSETPPRLIGADGGEPGDQTLLRDWRWVVQALEFAVADGAGRERARVVAWLRELAEGYRGRLARGLLSPSGLALSNAADALETRPLPGEVREEDECPWCGQRDHDPGLPGGAPVTRAEALAAVTEAVRALCAARRAHDLTEVGHEWLNRRGDAGVEVFRAGDTFRRAFGLAAGLGATLAEVTAAYDAGVREEAGK